jgi:hypothetical protein
MSIRNGNDEVRTQSFMTLGRRLMIRTTEDFVQWNRAEADMNRWREQYEIKHADFHRSIKYCKTFSGIWRKLVKEAEEGVSGPHALGKAAYGRRSAALWEEMEKRTRAAFKKVALPELADIPAGKRLHDQVRVWQQSELEAYFSPFYR